MDLEPPRAHSPLFLIVAMLAGLAAAKGWMHFSQPLVDTIQVNSIAVLACIYYALVYLPLAVLALVLGSVCGVKPWLAGSRPANWIGIGFAAGLFGMVFAALLARFNGGMVPAIEPTKAGGSLIAIGLALTLFQVLVEELLFRGWLRQTFRTMIGPRNAIVISALAYAAFSMTGSGFALLPFVNLVLLALFLGFLAERSGGIAAPVAAHFGWSAVEDIGLGLNPNPGAGPFGAIKDFDLLDAPLWGGSVAGLTASIGTAAVLAALILPLLSTPPKARALAD